MSEWKETPWRGDRASAALTHRPARHIATILEHRGASRLAEPGSLLEKKGVSKTNMCICFSAPINMMKYLKNQYSCAYWSKFLLFKRQTNDIITQIIFIVKYYLILDLFRGSLSYSISRVSMAHHMFDGVASTAMKDSDNLHTPEGQCDDSLSLPLYLCHNTTCTLSSPSCYSQQRFTIASSSVCDLLYVCVLLESLK